MNKSMNFLNRHATWIYIAAGICIVCVLLIPYGKRLYDQIPQYEWDEKQMGSTKSKEPFGAKYLDEYLHDYWKGKLYVEADADSAFAKFGKKKANYLFVNSGYQVADSAHIFQLISMANTGNRVLIADMEYEIARRLLIETWRGESDYFNIQDFLDRENEISRISLYLCEKSNGKPDSIMVWENMVTETICILQEDSLQNDTTEDGIVIADEYCDFYGDLPLGSYTPLISFNDKWDVAARRDIGKGCITLSFNNHLFFTNYAVQNKDLRIGMEHIMECTFDKSLPLIIIYNDYEDENDTDGTPFMVLLKHPATALFLWLLCAALAIAIIFNTRRRRRPENVNKKVQNSSINFIRHLATIYTDDTDYRELLRIEKRVLLYKLRKEFYFDMRTRDFSEVSQFASILAANRGLNEERVKEVLSTLEELTASGVQVDARSYRLCLEQLDTIN
ncbi:MAG: hypothetical protein II900_02635 [Prevotella sp.]|nr:hypothetical protein [Prevotella sp.]